MNRVMKHGKRIESLPSAMEFEYSSKTASKKKAVINTNEDEVPSKMRRKSNNAGMIRNKFKQMKSQEAIEDYLIGVQLQKYNAEYEEAPI